MDDAKERIMALIGEASKLVGACWVTILNQEDTIDGAMRDLGFDPDRFLFMLVHAIRLPDAHFRPCADCRPAPLDVERLERIRQDAIRLIDVCDRAKTMDPIPESLARCAESLGLDVPGFAGSLMDAYGMPCHEEEKETRQRSGDWRHRVFEHLVRRASRNTDMAIPSPSEETLERLADCVRSMPSYHAYKAILSEYGMEAPRREYRDDPPDRNGCDAVETTVEDLDAAYGYLSKDSRLHYICSGQTGLESELSPATIGGLRKIGVIVGDDFDYVSDRDIIDLFPDKIACIGEIYESRAYREHTYVAAT